MSGPTTPDATPTGAGGHAAATADEIAAALGLEPLEQEGGRFARHFDDDHSSAIYYLLAAGERSALHRLTATEVYHHYAGAPLALLLLHPDGRIAEPVLGPDIAAGQRPCVVVPAGVWQGSSPQGEWSLLGTTMAPAFEWGGFELGRRDALVRAYPAAAPRIAELAD